MFSTVLFPAAMKPKTIVQAECLALLTNAVVCCKAPSDLAQVSTRAGTSLR